jgi:hypothetical protein
MRSVIDKTQVVAVNRRPYPSGNLSHIQCVESLQAIGLLLATHRFVIQLFVLLNNNSRRGLRCGDFSLTNREIAFEAKT